MEDLNDLYFFAKVVENGGFAAAGRALGVPKSRLSRRIALLEERLGVRLIHRSTRRFAVTEVGEKFHRHCLAMLVETEAAEEVVAMRRAEPRGVVRVSCPASVLHFEVGAMITRFMAACPEVEVHLVSTNRRVDPIREGFDLAIRVRFPPLEESDLVMKVLSESPQHVVASPALLAGVSGPLVPADLAGFPSLGWGPPHGAHEWRLTGPDGASAVIPHKPRLVTEDMVTLRLAALAGIGIAQIPSIVLGRDLEEGRLVDLLSNWAPPTGILHASFPSRRGLLPAVRALLDFLAAEFAALSRREGWGRSRSATEAAHSEQRRA